MDRKNECPVCSSGLRPAGQPGPFRCPRCAREVPGDAPRLAPALAVPSSFRKRSFSPNVLTLAGLVLFAGAVFVAGYVVGTRSGQVGGSAEGSGPAGKENGGPPKRVTRLLADLKERLFVTGSGRFVLGDLGYPDPAPIFFKGKRYPKGLGLVPPREGPARVQYELRRTATSFHGEVAISDTAEPNGGARAPVWFEVYGDGKLLWSSSLFREINRSQVCDLPDVSSVDVLELRVDCTGERNWAHTVWLDPYVVLK